MAWRGHPSAQPPPFQPFYSFNPIFPPPVVHLQFTPPPPNVPRLIGNMQFVPPDRRHVGNTDPANTRMMWPPIPPPVGPNPLHLPPHPPRIPLPVLHSPGQMIKAPNYHSRPLAMEPHSSHRLEEGRIVSNEQKHFETQALEDPDLKDERDRPRTRRKEPIITVTLDGDIRKTSKYKSSRKNRRSSTPDRIVRRITERTDNSEIQKVKKYLRQRPKDDYDSVYPTQHQRIVVRKSSHSRKRNYSEDSTSRKCTKEAYRESSRSRKHANMIHDLIDLPGISLYWKMGAQCNLSFITPKAYKFDGLQLEDGEKLLVLGILRESVTFTDTFLHRVSQFYPHLKGYGANILLGAVFGKELGSVIDIKDQDCLILKDCIKNKYGPECDIVGDGRSRIPSNREQASKTYLAANMKIMKKAEGLRIKKSTPSEPDQFENFEKQPLTTLKKIQGELGYQEHIEVRKMLEVGVTEEELEKQLHNLFPWLQWYTVNSILLACFPSRFHRYRWIFTAGDVEGSRFFVYNQYSTGVREKIVRYILSASSIHDVYKKIDYMDPDFDPSITCLIDGQKAFDTMISIWPKDFYNFQRNQSKTPGHVMISNLIQYKYIGMESPAAIDLTSRSRILTKEHRFIFLGMLHHCSLNQQILEDFVFLHPEIKSLSLVDDVLYELFGPQYEEFVERYSETVGLKNNCKDLSRHQLQRRIPLSGGINLGALQDKKAVKLTMHSGNQADRDYGEDTITVEEDYCEDEEEDSGFQNEEEQYDRECNEDGPLYIEEGKPEDNLVGEESSVVDSDDGFIPL